MPPPPVPDEEDDPEFRAALAASVEANDLEELGRWPHLVEVLRTSSLEAEAMRARQDADAWAFLEMARRQEEETRQAALREEEERMVRLMHEAEAKAAEGARREKEEARLGRLRRPATPPHPHSLWEEALWPPWPCDLLLPATIRRADHS